MKTSPPTPGGRDGPGAVNHPPPRHVTGVDVLVFAAEIAVYVAVGWAAWHGAGGGVLGVLAAVAAVAVMATWWGLLHSPRARVRLPRPADIALRACWFLVGAAAAWVVLAA